MKNKNNIRRCLYCYQELDEASIDFHAKCCKKFFGTNTQPTLSITSDELKAMAEEIVKKSITIPGVQPKLSLNVVANPDDPKKSRLTVVGLWGQYILKPQSPSYIALPENEDLTMNLAQIAGIPTADHSLIRTSSGELAYITKRFDRKDKTKFPLEDFCQLSELPSSAKYNSSMERAGKIIRKYSSIPGQDVTTFFELTLFCFLTGNADMHLKNFSILKGEDNQYRLAPAYDLLSTVLAMPDDKEQTALTLNSKKNKIIRKDLNALASNLRIDLAVYEKIISNLENNINSFEKFINISFLSDDMRKTYIDLIVSRIKILST